VCLLLLLCLQADFRKAKEKVLYKKTAGVPEGLYM
jgi:26S proteasome regulatory subunit T2